MSMVIDGQQLLKVTVVTYLLLQHLQTLLKALRLFVA